MNRSNWFAVTFCMLLVCLTSGCVEKPPIATAWRNNEFLLTNTSDSPLHHITIEVTRDVGEKSFEEFVVSLPAHETRTFRWNPDYSPVAGGRIIVSCSGYSGKSRLRIKKQ